jgi:hypothetical protein
MTKKEEKELWTRAYLKHHHALTIRRIEANSAHREAVKFADEFVKQFKKKFESEK